MNAITKPAQSEDKRGRGRSSNPVDVHVGKRLRRQRTLLGLSQEKLGEQIGLTFQQVQKYERGANRIGASRLYDLSCTLGVPISYFFDEMPEEIAQKTIAERRQMPVDMDQDTDVDPMNRRETLELVRAYCRLPDAALRKKFYDLLKAMAPGETAEVLEPNED